MFATSQITEVNHQNHYILAAYMHYLHVQDSYLPQEKVYYYIFALNI